LTRKRWKDLTPAYRRRLQRQGITGKTHRTADLRVFRGHVPRPPTGAAPTELTARTVAGEDSDQDRRELENWRATAAPAWLPGPVYLGDDAAAALSQLRRGPSQWKRVTLTPTAVPADPMETAAPWTMTVEYVRGYPQTILIPAESAREVLDMLSLVDATTPHGAADTGEWESWEERGRDFDVEGTP